MLSYTVHIWERARQRWHLRGLHTMRPGEASLPRTITFPPRRSSPTGNRHQLTRHNVNPILTSRASSMPVSYPIAIASVAHPTNAASTSSTSTNSPSTTTSSSSMTVSTSATPYCGQATAAAEALLLRLDRPQPGSARHRTRL
jgi:hypothetical protein